MSTLSSIGSQLSSPGGKVVGAALGLGTLVAVASLFSGKSNKGGPKPIIGQDEGVLDLGIWAGFAPRTPGWVFYASKIPTLSVTQLKSDIATMESQKSWLMTSKATKGTQDNRRGVYAPYVQEWINVYNEELTARSKPVDPVKDAGVVLAAPTSYTRRPAVGAHGIPAASGKQSMTLMVIVGIAVLAMAVILLIVLL